MKYAVVYSDKSGPAFALGNTTTEALEAYCESNDGLGANDDGDLTVVAITDESAALVEAGDPDAWEEINE